MAVVIDFAKKAKERAEKSNISLKTFNLTKRDVDTSTLYPYIDPKYKTFNLNGAEFRGVQCLGKKELFGELTRVSKEFDSKRVAWIVLDGKTDYIYIKELDNIYKEEKSIFEKEVKEHLYRYAIDHLLILEQINRDTYRWIVD